MRTRLTAVLGSFVLVLAAVPAADARSLADKLSAFLTSNTLGPFLENQPVVDPITPIIEREAIRGIDFPAPPSSPAFAYTYNPELQVFERSSGSLGPEFAERAQTAGVGRFTLGFSYLFADLRDVDGRNFGKRIGSAYVCGSPTCTVVNPGTGTEVNSIGKFLGRHFSLMTHVFSFSGTYGITDRWDVNLLVPLLYSELHLDGRGSSALIDPASGGIIAGSAVSTAARFNDNAFGVGDILVRTKYRFNDGPGPLFAGAFTVRTPSGNEDDFQGLGDVTLTPAIIGTKNWGPHELHGSLGVEVDAQDLDRSRARYGIGGVIQPIEKVGILLDVVGSSSFVDDEFTVSAGGRIPQVFESDFQNTDFIRDPNTTRAFTPTGNVVGFVPRSDIVDLNVGLKVNIFSTAIAYVGAIVPLTKDGLRADVIPAGAVEYTF